MACVQKLAEFDQSEAIEILDRFAEAEILDKVKNKAAFCAYARDCHTHPTYTRQKFLSTHVQMRAYTQDS
jgi:hypothetical protein